MKRVTRTRVGKLLPALLLVVASVGLTAPAPVSASPTNNAVGVAEFEGKATLPKFPCPPPPPFGTGPCTGTFKGDWAGHLTGMWNGREFDITWRTLGSTGISVPWFNYFETSCTVPQAGSLLGYATGTGRAVASNTAAQAQVFGVVYNNSPGGFPWTVSALEMTFTFEWTRVANGAVITLYPLSFKATVTGLGTPILVNTAQRGEADFVPTHTSAPPTGVPNCTTPLTNVEGQITGSVQFAHNP